MLVLLVLSVLLAFSGYWCRQGRWWWLCVLCDCCVGLLVGVYGWASKGARCRIVGVGDVDVDGQVWVLAAPPPTALDGTYQLRYLANLDKGDSFVNLTNAGTLSGFDPAGRICVNAYTFDPAEELISCCACPVTPNGLNSLSARNDLISNTLTPGVPTSITVKLVSSAVFNAARLWMPC